MTVVTVEGSVYMVGAIIVEAQLMKDFRKAVKILQPEKYLEACKNVWDGAGTIHQEQLAPFQQLAIFTKSFILDV